LDHHMSVRDDMMVCFIAIGLQKPLNPSSLHPNDAF